MKTDQLTRWTTEQAAQLYGVRDWGNGYFDISEDGSITVCPRGKSGGMSVKLTELVSGIKLRGMELPVLLRFSDILDQRIIELNEGFARAIAEVNYQSPYRAVYPIKVNQQQQVIEEIVEFGHKYHHGLEAGSKAELVAALAYMHDPEAYIICNGYKDKEFIDLALYALTMGLQAVIVIEMPSELRRVMRQAEKLGVTPVIGIRAKLAARAEGHWNESGGDGSTFGLTVSQIVDAIDYLRDLGQLDCLKLLHYHLGSQIPNIRSIRNAVSEAMRIYVEMVREGAPMGILDVGGGLAVDYDGSHTNFASSSNYSVHEYAADIVEAVMLQADGAEVAHPVLVSESGRATVAYQSVLLFNILEVSRYDSHELPPSLPAESPEMLHHLWEVNEIMSAKNIQECYHDAVYYRDELRNLFQHGHVGLRARAMGERIFSKIIRRIAGELKHMTYIPDELEGLNESIADVYHANFSVFQSLPDAWAIQQLFPLAPIQRLDQEPDRYAKLSDITCDCDGKLDRFTDLHDIKRVLPLHQIGEEEYCMGAFIVGAYQETLGDLHNLFGDTNVVCIRIREDGTVEYSREIEGDTVADVLSYVEYNPADMVQRFRLLAERAVREERISPSQRKEIMDAYHEGLRGYTYFEH